MEAPVPRSGRASAAAVLAAIFARLVMLVSGVWLIIGIVLLISSRSHAIDAPGLKWSTLAAFVIYMGTRTLAGRAGN